MMKKYNTPEIEALALETVDVIATSGNDAALKALQDAQVDTTNATNYGSVADLSDTWSW